jgi:hypothetical protein
MVYTTTSHRLSVNVLVSPSCPPRPSNNLGKYTLNIVYAVKQGKCYHSLRIQQTLYEIDLPNDIQHQAAQTNNVVRNHSGVKTIATLSTQAAIGFRMNRGIIRYNFGDFVSMIEAVLARRAERREIELASRGCLGLLPALR